MSRDSEKDYQHTSEPTWIDPGAMDRIKHFAYDRGHTIEEVIETVTASPITWDAVVNYRY